MSHERLGFMKGNASTKQICAKVMPERVRRLAVEAVPAEQHPHLLRHLVRVVRAACLRQEQLMHHGGVADSAPYFPDVMSKDAKTGSIQRDRPSAVILGVGNDDQSSLEVDPVWLSDI